MRWDRNVYRHPLRQGHDLTEKYRMQHDIYSLNVCLLEIGLWESFVEYVPEDGGPTRSSPSLVERTTTSRLGFGRIRSRSALRRMMVRPDSFTHSPSG
jgi:hypothetical protein